MRQFTVYSEDQGKILRTGSCSNRLLELQAKEGEIVIEGSYHNRIHWIDNGTPTPRPEIGLPETHTVAANTEWIISGVPDGTEILTDGQSAGTADGSDVVLTFPEAGRWSVEMRPPFPWRKARCEVTVT